jgi:hypothetical protein
VTAHFATLVVSPDAAAARTAREALARAAERLGDSAAYGFGYVSSLSPAGQ